MLRSLALVILLAISARGAPAQCPDGTPPPCRGGRPGAAPMSVAVLNFGSLSRDSTDQLLGEGLAEELTSRLGQVARLRITSRTAVTRLRNADALSTAQIGRVLNTAHLVSGSIRRAGSLLRVTVELVRAATGEQEWAGQFDHASENLLAIQEDIATAVAAAVAGRLLPAERTALSSRPTSSSEAYAAYLTGIAASHGRGDYGRALTYQQRAVALDSGFALAWSELSRDHAAIFWRYTDRSDARLAMALAAAQRALALAPGLAAPHVSMALYHYWGARDYGGALAELRIALQLAPNDPEVHSAMANVLRRQGDYEGSLASRLRAIALAPDRGLDLAEAGTTYLVLRRFDDAERFLDSAAAVGLDYNVGHINRVLDAFGHGRPMAAVRGSIDWLVGHPGDAATEVFGGAAELLPLTRMVTQFQESVLRAPASDGEEAQAGLLVLRGEALTSRGDSAGAAVAYDSARVAIERIVRERPAEAAYRGALSLVYASLGRRADAIREADEAQRLLPFDRDRVFGPELEQLLAYAMIRAGETDRALTLLAHLASVPAFVNPGLLRTDPIYAPLRGNPRFERLIAEPSR